MKGDVTALSKMTTEAKAQELFEFASEFSDVVRLKALDRFHDTYIMRFDWPKEKGSTISKSSKMITQVKKFLLQIQCNLLRPRML